MSSAAEDRVRRHRYRVEDYCRMAEVGILAPDARVELVDGEVIEMAPIDPAHASVATDIQTRLVRAIGERAAVRVQNPVHLGPRDEPQPDIAVVTPPPSKYRARHPEPADILLLVEVADSSLSLDRDLKLPVYARSGIPEVWLIDLTAGGFRRYRTPGPAGYLESKPATELAAIPFPGLAGVVVDLTRLL